MNDHKNPNDIFQESLNLMTFVLFKKKVDPI